jgi:hypothetical protein
MSDNREFERAVDGWLASGSDRTPAPVIDAVLFAVKTTAQERDPRISWRTPTMSLPMRLVAGIALVAVLGVGALTVMRPGVGPGGVATLTPPPSPSPTLAPSPTPSLAAAPSPIDTTGWTTYASSQYGFKIGHPADWTEVPASRAWSFKADSNDWLSPGMDAFFTPIGEGVRVSAWAVPLDPAFNQSSTDVEAWIGEYCQKTGNAPCPGIHDRAVPLCLERRDCHPGLLVPFESDVQAFFTGGGSTRQMVIVAVWWGESEPAVAPYGGSRRLLEAFLSTMCVWPEDARPPFGVQIPGC